MPKIYVCLSSIRAFGDEINLSYTAVFQHESHTHAYGADFVLDPSKSLGDNVDRLKSKIIADVDHGLDVHPGDVLIFGAPIADQEAMQCCAHGITSVNRSGIVKDVSSGIGSFVKSFFTPPPPPEPIAQFDDPRVHEHTVCLEELKEQVKSLQTQLNQIPNHESSLEHLHEKVSSHNHPYPERMIQLEKTLEDISSYLENHITQYQQDSDNMMSRLIVLETPPPPPSIVESEPIVEPVVEPISPPEPTHAPELGFWDMTKKAIKDLWTN